MRKSAGLTAPIYMIISAFSFALMSAAVKQADSIPFMQKVFFRNFIMLLMVLPPLFLMSAKKGAAVFTAQKGHRGWLLLRSSLGFFGVVFYFFSVERLPLGDSAMLNKLSAFFVIILSAIFLREKIRSYHVPALIAAFTGALLIIKPGFNMTLIPAAIGIAAAVFAASAYTVVAVLKGKEDSLTIIFWFSAVSTVASVVPVLLLWETPNRAELIALILTGIFAAGGQYFITMAYTHGPAGEVSIYNYTHVVFSVVIGFIIWREIPDILSALGAVLIIGAATGLFLRGRRAADVQKV